MSIALARRTEHDKYVRAYTDGKYGMGAARMQDAVADLRALPCRGSYLDVGCGRGEMLSHARRLGFEPVQGMEIVSAFIDGQVVLYGEVHALPFSDHSFDVVTMFDVIEHLITGDDELGCREIQRVVRKHVLITANNRHSQNSVGDDLHINKRAYDEWDTLIRRWFHPASVCWIKENRRYISETWRIDLC